MPVRRGVGDKQFLPAIVQTRRALIFRIVVLRSSKWRTNMDPVLVTIPDAANALGLGRSKTYSLIDQGQLETVRIGRRRLVLVSSIHRLAENGRSK